MVAISADALEHLIVAAKNGSPEARNKLVEASEPLLEKLALHCHDRDLHSSTPKGHQESVSRHWCTGKRLDQKNTRETHVRSRMCMTAWPNA